LDLALAAEMLKVPIGMGFDDSSIGLAGLALRGVARLLSQRRQSVAIAQLRLSMAAVFQRGSTGGQMAGTYVIYYPPTAGHPYLVVTFQSDSTLQVTAFDSEEEAETFIERNAPQLPD